MTAVFQSQYGPSAVFSQQYGSIPLQVSVNSELLYSIKGAIVDDISLLSNIRSSIESQYGQNYSIRQELSSDASLIYDVLSAGQVQSNFTVSYNTRSFESIELGLTWSIRSVETSDSSLVYIVKGFVQSPAQEITYKIYSNATTNSALVYNVRNSILKDSALSYSILGLTQIKKDLPLLYSILSTISPDWTDVYIETSGATDIYIRSQDTFIVILK